MISYVTPSILLFIFILKSSQGRFTVGMYVDEMRRSEWCLHFRGDTTTARRFYDSIAAGCVPIIVSDGVNLPFVDRLDWRAFTVSALRGLA